MNICYPAWRTINLCNFLGSDVDSVRKQELRRLFGLKRKATAEGCFEQTRKMEQRDYETAIHSSLDAFLAPNGNHKNIYMLCHQISIKFNVIFFSYRTTCISPEDGS
jgi:hypothetical protein